MPGEDKNPRPIIDYLLMVEGHLRDYFHLSDFSRKSKKIYDALSVILQAIREERARVDVGAHPDLNLGCACGPVAKCAKHSEAHPAPEPDERALAQEIADTFNDRCKEDFAARKLRYWVAATADSVLNGGDSVWLWPILWGKLLEARAAYLKSRGPNHHWHWSWTTGVFSAGHIFQCCWCGKEIIVREDHIEPGHGKFYTRLTCKLPEELCEVRATSPSSPGAPQTCSHKGGTTVEERAAQKDKA